MGKEDNKEFAPATCFSEQCFLKCGLKGLSFVWVIIIDVYHKGSCIIFKSGKGSQEEKKNLLL